MILEVTNLTKRFQDLLVLDSIDFSVDQGDVVAILGPSGSGKTTMLRCLNFLEKADEGILTFDGTAYDLHRIGKRDVRKIRMHTGFVFQNFNLFENKTALENVAAGLRYARRVPKKEAYERALSALEKVGLRERAGHYPHQLSGGQQQRVAIARSIVTDPEILYFDEPTSALDPEITGEVLSVMRKLADDGMTMVVVTHELSFAEHVANRVVFMDASHIEEENTAREFFASPKSARAQSFIKGLIR